MMRRNLAVRRQTLIRIAKTLVPVVLLVWLVKSGHLDFRVLLSAPPSAIHLLGILAVVAHMLLQSVRWWWLIGAQGIDLSLGQAVQLSWIGQFFNLVLPGAAGGELVRAYYAAQDESRPRLAGVSTVLVDRSIGLYSLTWLGLLSLLGLLVIGEEVTSAVAQMAALIMVLFFGISAFFLALVIRPVGKTVAALVPDRFGGALKTTLESYQTHVRQLFGCFGLSLVASLVVMAEFVLAGKVLGSSLGWQQVFLVGPLVLVANSLPISPGGVGVAETTAALLFSQFGVQTGAAIMLIVRLWTLVVRLPGGLMYAIHTRRSSVVRSVGQTDPTPRMAGRL